MKKTIFITVILSLVIILNSCGGGGSDGSNALYTPAIPTDLSVKECDESIVTIEWSDNSDNESGFVIERSVNGGDYNLLITTGPNKTEFTEALPDETIYTYRIYAFNSAGDSNLSNETSIKRPRSAKVDITTGTGGTIKLTNLATIAFPPDSFSSDESIMAVEGVMDGSVTEDKKPYLDLVSDIKVISIVDFTSKDLELKKSIKLVMNYDSGLLAKINENLQKSSTELITEGITTQADVDKMMLDAGNLDIYYFNSLTGKWIKTNASLDTNLHTLSINASYLGIYCVGYSQAVKTGHSFEMNADVQQQMIDMIDKSDKHEDSGNKNSNRYKSSAECITCRDSLKTAISKSIDIDPAPDWYRDSCTRTTPLIINGVEVDKIPGTDKKTKCDNCSSYGGYLADKLSGFAFTSACANHDGCYRYGYTTYGKIKERCDLRLWAEMLLSCIEKYPLIECKKFSVFGKTLGICYSNPLNIILFPNCSLLASVTYIAVMTPATYSAIVPYDHQPCFDYYKDGVNCNTPILRAIDIDGTGKSYCEPGEAIDLKASVYNPDGRSIAYAWSAIAGTVSNPSAVDITWSAPSTISDDTEVTIPLTISDGINIIPSKTLTLKVLKPYALTYNANNAESGTVPAATSHNYYGDAVVISGNTGNLARTGYSFAGWNTQADGSGSDRPAGSFFIMGKSDIILYAKWTKFPVNYNGNGNTGGSAPVDSTIYQIGDLVTVKGNTGVLVRNYDSFLCWNTAVDGTGTNYFPDDTFSLASKNMYLYTRWSWTRLLGVSGTNTFGASIAVDSIGNIYVAGNTTGNLDGQLKSGTNDIYITKYNSSGTKQWTRLNGISGLPTYCSSVTIDSIGNLYITGCTYGNLDGQILTGARDMFVVKYDSSGVKQWTRLLGVSGVNTYGKAIITDIDRNFYITGYTFGNLDGQILTGSQDMFVVKYDSSGSKLWTRLLGTSGEVTVGKDIAVDLNGNTYVTGFTYGNLDGQILTGVCDMFVAKYNSSGSKQWTKFLGSSGLTEGNGIKQGSDGYLYITGSVRGNNLDGQILTGFYDIFVVKYDSSGTKQWTRLLGVSGSSTCGYDIAVDLSGNCYVTGSTSGSLDGQLLNGTNDAFVSKYDSSGTKQWTKLIGVSNALTAGNGIAVDLSGTCYVTGTTFGNLDGQSLTGSSDMFVTTKLNQ